LTDLITTGITAEEREGISAEEQRPRRDFRDWAEINEWASGIADALEFGS
jgi:hypothetical protein